MLSCSATTPRTCLEPSYLATKMGRTLAIEMDWTCGHCRLVLTHDPRP